MNNDLLTPKKTRKMVRDMNPIPKPTLKQAKTRILEMILETPSAEDVTKLVDALVKLNDLIQTEKLFNYE